MCEVGLGKVVVRPAGISMEEERKIARPEERVLFSSNSEGKDPFIEDLNRIVTSVVLSSLFSAFLGRGSDQRLQFAFTGAVVALGYSVTATGLTYLLPDLLPRAPSPFLIRGATLIACVVAPVPFGILGTTLVVGTFVACAPPWLSTLVIGELLIRNLRGTPG